MDNDEEAEVNTLNPTRMVIGVCHASNSGKEPAWQESSMFCLCVILMFGLILVCDVILFKYIKIVLQVQHNIMHAFLHNKIPKLFIIE